MFVYEKVLMRTPKLFATPGWNAFIYKLLLSMINESCRYPKYITQSVVFQKYPLTGIPENSWSENLGKTRVGFSFLKSRKLQNCNFTERDTLAEVFCCNF